MSHEELSELLREIQKHIGIVPNEFGKDACLQEVREQVMHLKSEENTRGFAAGYRSCEAEVRRQFSASPTEKVWHQGGLIEKGRKAIIVVEQS